jgi:antitoxin VapB
MHITKVFKSGEVLAVEIPAALAYEHSDVEFEIERIGDELRIRPARRRLTGVLAKFAAFAGSFMDDGRGEHEQSARERR